MSGLCLPGSEPRLRSLLFGFSVFKSFQIVREGGEQRNYLIGARQFGLLLVSVGLISLVLATLQYRQNIRMPGEEYQGRPRSLAVIVVGLISILGILALTVMIFRERFLNSFEGPASSFRRALRVNFERHNPRGMKSHEQWKR